MSIKTDISVFRHRRLSENAMCNTNNLLIRENRSRRRYQTTARSRISEHCLLRNVSESVNKTSVKIYQIKEKKISFNLIAIQPRSQL